MYKLFQEIKMVLQQTTSNKIIKSIVGLAVLASSGLANAGSWTDKVSLSNDFRFRNEYIDVTEDANSAPDSAPPQVRQRLRARLGLTSTLSDNLKIGLGLASGSDDPVSTNETFDGGFSTKGFNLDLAYFQWTAMEDLTLIGGKSKVAFYTPGKSELIWDGDLNPEGLSLAYNHKMGDFGAGLVLSEYVAEENSGSDDVILTGAQLNLNAGLMGGDLAVNLGAGVFEYSNIKGHKTLYNNNKGFGNSTTSVDPNPALDGDEYKLYNNGYHITEFYVEVTTKSLGVPMTLFYDSANNDSVSTKGAASKMGLIVGKAKEKGSWAFRVLSREVEADSVLGVFTDSDFRGGGTNGKGLELGADYKLADNVETSFTWFQNEQSVDNGAKYQRAQLDFAFKL